MVPRVLALCLLITAACGRGEPGPTAHPDTVVAAAPDRTLATRSATVLGAAPGITAQGTVDFTSGVDKLTVSPPPKTEPPFGVIEPAAMLDLLRGVIEVSAYGGAEVQGIGTKRYQVDIDVAKAIAATPEARRADLRRLDNQLADNVDLWADVFVDSAGRVRRILLPVKTALARPYGDSKKIPQMVSVDFSNFGA